MFTLSCSVGGICVLGVLFSSVPAFAQDKQPGPAIEVQVNYLGSGRVDGKHKIFIILWDSPDFIKGGGVMPVSIKSTDSNTGTVTFSDIKTMPAYIGSAYDSTGGWDGKSGPLPAGTSLGVYKSPGELEPIKALPGDTAKVTFAFDDSIKMQ